MHHIQSLLSPVRLTHFNRGVFALLTLLVLTGLARPAYAQYEVDIPKATTALNCVGSSGIAVGTIGMCDVAHLVSDDIHSNEPIGGYHLTGDSEFTIDSTSTCTTYATVSPGCSIIIDFKPTSVGTKTASLVITGTGAYATHTSTIPITGQGLPGVASCAQSETPECIRNDGTVMPAAYCGGSATPVSQACTSATCSNTACTTGLSASRFIDLGRICTGKGGCISFYPLYGVTDKLGNSCGSCTTRVANKTPCPSVTAANACGTSYTVSKRECIFYDVNNTTSTTTFSPSETLPVNCIYTLADSSGTTCGSCEATWVNIELTSSPIGTPTSNTTCPFTPY